MLNWINRKLARMAIRRLADRIEQEHQKSQQLGTLVEQAIKREAERHAKALADIAQREANDRRAIDACLDDLVARSNALRGKLQQMEQPIKIGTAWHDTPKAENA